MDFKRQGGDSWTAQTTLILRGGFGGIAAGNSLRRLLPKEHEIIVVDKSSHFRVGAGETWLMVGQRTYEQISQARTARLDPGVRFHQAGVLGLDLGSRSVETDRETLRWDYPVIAPGADLNDASVPGLAQAAHTLCTVEGAQRLRGALERFAGGHLALLIPRVPFKCPAAPYEAAMLLHHTFASRGLGAKVRIAIHTVEGAPMATAGPEMGQCIKAELGQRGIGFSPQKKTAHVDGGAQRIVFEDGTEARYDLLFSVPPHEAPKAVRDARLVNQSGWIPIDPQTLQGKSEGGAGRYKPDMPLSLPKAGVFAEAHGRVVAHQVAAKILGTAPSMVFDGKGYCYLETGGGRAVKADGAFFELPHPVMRQQPSDEVQFRDKKKETAAWSAGASSLCGKRSLQILLD